MNALLELLGLIRNGDTMSFSLLFGHRERLSENEKDMELATAFKGILAEFEVFGFRWWRTLTKIKRIASSGAVIRQGMARWVLRICGGFSKSSRHQQSKMELLKNDTESSDESRNAPSLSSRYPVDCLDTTKWLLYSTLHIEKYKRMTGRRCFSTTKCTPTSLLLPI